MVEIEGSSVAGRSPVNGDVEWINIEEIVAAGDFESCNISGNVTLALIES